MASGGSLKVKLPSLISTSWLIAQPPASSLNLSSKTISVPSQANAGQAKAATISRAAAPDTLDLAMSGSLASLPPRQVSLACRPALGNRGARKDRHGRLPDDGHRQSPGWPYRP